MQENDKQSQMFQGRSGHFLRREFLAATGVGLVGSTVAGGTAAAADRPYDGPFSRTYEPATVSPEEINVLSGQAPDDEGEGEEVDRTVPRKAPEGDDTATGSAGPAQTDATEGGLVETDFDGMSALDVRGVVPSDNQVAAGQGHLVQAINSQIAFFTKDGERVFQSTLDAFFEPATPVITEENLHSGFFDTYIIFDPRARYDAANDRFVVACVDLDLTSFLGGMLVAVSSSPDPTDEWYAYYVRPIPQQGADPTPGLVDYPELGLDAEALYLTENFFPSGFTQATMAALDKTDAYAGDPVDANHFTDLRNPDGSLAFTVQPADGGGYFANSRFFQGQSLTLWSMADPVGDPTLTNQAVRVAPYTNPPEGANQPETEEKIDMGDDRVLRVSYDGSSVWVAQTVDDGRARVTELDPAGDVRQRVEFRENGEKTFFPSVAADGENAVFVFNTSSSEGDGDGYVDVGVASVAAGGDGRVDRVEEVAAGENDYDYVDPDENDAGTQTLRWGDYNGAVRDPDGGFWITGQYAKLVDLDQPEHIVDNFYGTRIAKVTAR